MCGCVGETHQFWKPKSDFPHCSNVWVRSTASFPLSVTALFCFPQFSLCSWCLGTTHLHMNMGPKTNLLLPPALSLCTVHACSRHSVCVRAACTVRACLQRAQCVPAMCTMRACSVHNASVQCAQCVRAVCTVGACLQHGMYTGQTVHTIKSRGVLRCFFLFSLHALPASSNISALNNSNAPTTYASAPLPALEEYRQFAYRRHCFEKRSGASCIMHHALQLQQNHQPPQRQAKPPLEWRDGIGGQKMTDTTVIFPV